MKRTMTTIAAIAALCLSACILPSCYVRISDDAKAKIQEELQDIDFTETLEPFDTLEIPDSLMMPDTLTVPEDLEELESLEELEKLLGN
ncbi:MAG: hypothetical protein IIU20_06580 [Bacteroidales bacterium]|nr:hypothetical protein [Bacteroidales bacterium]MEE3476365.1 hypothetical protein [Candidatus Cryptobacteroides sp.]